MKNLDVLLHDLRHYLEPGPENAVPASVLSDLMGMTERTVGALVAEARQRGELIGSLCDAGQHGYFIPRSREELDLGTRHMRARAKSIFRVIGVQRVAADRRFGPEAATLFSLDEVEEVGTG